MKTIQLRKTEEELMKIRDPDPSESLQIEHTLEDEFPFATESLLEDIRIGKRRLMVVLTRLSDAEGNFTEERHSVENALHPLVQEVLNGKILKIVVPKLDPLGIQQRLNSASQSAASEEVANNVHDIQDRNLHIRVKGELYCIFCMRRFRTKSDYVKHNKTMLNSQRYKCEHCKETYSSMGNFHRHCIRRCSLLDCFLLYEKEKKPQIVIHTFNCCDKIFSNFEEFSAHIKLPHLSLSTDESELVCSVCKKLFVAESEAKLHLLQTCGKKHNACLLYKCTQCAKLYKRQRTLRTHVQYVHVVKRWPCSECGLLFSSPTLLTKHKKYCSNKGLIHCEQCSKVFAYPCLLKRHVESQHMGAKRFACELCSYKFNRKDSLLTHMKKQHIDRESFICAYCGEEKKYKQELRHHIIRNHLTSTDQKYLCCKMLFSDEKSLKQHRMRVHVPKFSCDSCGSKFKTKTGLRSHVLVHLPLTTPYVCDTCGKKCSQKSSLTSHMKTHFKKRAKFVCAHCEKWYEIKHQLKVHILCSHMNIPRSHECKLCNKSFKMLVHLQSHVKVVHGDKNYICAYCQKEFSTKQSLERHIMWHINFKQYKCPYCRKSFVQKGNMKDHIQTRHKN